MAQDDISRKVELSYLAAFYGPLLTPRQREAVVLHCEEDLSLGEIAQEMGISRQAVHDAITRAAEKLFGTEEQLHAARRFSRIEQELIRCRDALRAGRTGEAEKLLDEMIRQEQEDANGL